MATVHLTVDVNFRDKGPNFEEAKHPRGQPGNAGEFAPKGGAVKSSKPAATKGKPAQSKTAQSKPAATAATQGKGAAQTKAAPQSAAPSSRAKHVLAPAPADRNAWPEHIKAMRVPPAWTDVQINPDPQAPLQVIGHDVKGRKQYIYNRHFAQSQASMKFARIKELEGKIAPIREQNRKNQQSKDPATRDHADATALIMDMGVRPGSEEDTGAAVKAYGATTLEGRHVKVSGKEVRLQFVAKKGVNLDLPVTDPGLADMLRQRAKAAGPKGQLFPHVSAASMLQYVHNFDGGGFKTKDFRTLLATKTAVAEVAKLAAPANPAQYKKAVKQVATAVSQKLGNTPTVALQSYINPVVFAEWQAAAGGQ